MRVYTERHIEAGHAIKADDINAELISCAGAFNGGIGSSQIPLDSLGPDSLEDMTQPDDDFADDDTHSTYGVGSSYHRSVLQSSGPSTPNVTVDPVGEAIWNGWQPIYATTTGNTGEGSVLEFDAREGMIRGSAMVDWERRANYVRLTTGGVDTHAPTNDNNTIRFGVFVNDVLVADTGWMFPRRDTTELPFTSASPAGACRIEVRWMLKTVEMREHGYTEGGTTWTYPVTDSERYTEAKLYSMMIWCRNQYR